MVTMRFLIALAFAAPMFAQILHVGGHSDQL